MANEGSFISGFLSSASQNGQMVDVDYKALSRMLDRSPAFKGAMLRVINGEFGDATLDDIGSSIDKVVTDHDAYNRAIDGNALPARLQQRADRAANDLLLPDEPEPLLRRRRKAPRSGC